MRQLLTGVLLAFALIPAAARDVYRHIAPDGSVSFSDQPVPGAETIRLPEPRPAAPLNLPARTPAGTDAPQGPTSYSVLEMLEPEPEASVRSNQGQATVRVRLEPPLAEGDHLQVVVDGQVVPGELRSTSLQLNELVRGTHTVQVNVVSAGQVVRSTAAVRFHMRQESALTRQRLGLGEFKPAAPPANNP
ncbi:MAG: DUF4124 domain-containing protein [Chromatiales bacterium]|nr:DUF4124 domain-containing protein [Chromatiales bacterium]